MSQLSFNDVSLTYPARDRNGAGQLVLDRISLSLSTGEFVAVIGRSGSGKTSLLNLAAGFQEPSEGTVALDGAPIDGPGTERAVVFQDDALYPWLVARDNVAFPLKLRGVGERDRRARAEELLELVGLPTAGNRRISELSGGMRQRVGIARALAAEPRFLLLDEPLGALDSLTRSRMQTFLLNVWTKSGSGALLITHSIDEALLLATRIVVLSPNPGRLAADIPSSFAADILSGTPAGDVRASPAFKRMHDGLIGLIHTASPEEELAA
ncbi:taurine ABC transporter ATP-binding protein (plasmid) [Sinorhizobium americanum CCGM7]|uniref:taurine ABC transporter ATP-binding protein n=1 Tax=Sinorhizobium americanum TaxID=194963 RepID=UPI0004DAA53E|nr:ABC transporter ATP-binding protein [Sinorhizobium americanum]APG88304.1 taurine ABC transporter ATP-binding protein [Sinorhizobium americanum CCGM7]